ncbi:3-phosphoshikimate 1-carboxyvinyltransferase [Paenibacillus hodogayensis]|uniref:3-phosphoshikimate 1-carboxyvinyltransferase n=1 Tax=Paenibacillus hodogayensis TaxID=279208 RepID=A0ABV5VTI0_9BACL
MEKKTEADLEARSPWTGLAGIAEAELVPPAKPPQGEDVRAPGSKSVSNRALLLAALADGPSVIRNVLRSDDTYWCIDALRRLGVTIEVTGDEVRVEGIGGDWPNRQAELYIGAAGTVARFLPGALAAAPSGQWTLRGSRSLSARPLAPLVQALGEAGANIRYAEDDGRLPLVVTARGLEGGRIAISGDTSSQFASGLLLASPYARRTTHITVPGGIVQQAYVGITIDWMRRFGANVVHDERFGRFEVAPGRYTGRQVEIEADASTACYYLAYAAVTGGRVRVTNLQSDTRQPDIRFAGVLERMGCRVQAGPEGVELSGPARLAGGFSVSMREMSDQTLTLAAIAPFADAPITIADVAHIRHHECDRITAICASLRALGIDVEEREDGLTVHPGVPVGCALPTWDDHRVAMSLALIGARTSGIRLLDPGCVSKTCPSFFDDLRRLGMEALMKRA